eukprot:TRINITY_DN10135_c0_g1_i5.p1 TRINITY_DN10135_c0_g1~~TRINITY_DN10135_c0_g1_i5.p1  ORF type:complete len:747 (+),score=171.12 TRINITY_DN10135_c0_g1_i5:89-2329(+)
MLGLEKSPLLFGILGDDKKDKKICDILSRRDRIKVFAKQVKLVKHLLDKEQRYLAGHTSCSTSFVRGVSATSETFSNVNDDLSLCMGLLLNSYCVIEEETVAIAAYLTHLCNLLGQVLQEAKATMEIVAKYEKLELELKYTRESPDLISKKSDKKDVAQAHLVQLEEAFRDTKIKTLANLMDTEEKIQIVLAQITLKYLNRFEVFFRKNLEIFNDKSYTISRISERIDSQSQNFKERNREAELIEELRAKIFGISIEELLAREGNVVPTFIEQAFSFLKKHEGYSVEGLFRIPGRKSEIDEFIQKADQDGIINFGPFEDTLSGIHNVTGLIKIWLRSLPIALITDAIYDKCAAILGGATGRDEMSDQIKKVIELELPSHHLSCLSFILFHLNEIHLKCDENKMDSKNLAMVVGPNMVSQRDSDDPIEYLRVNTYVKTLVAILIENSSWFPVPPRVSSGKRNSSETAVEKAESSEILTPPKVEYGLHLKVLEVRELANFHENIFFILHSSTANQSDTTSPPLRADTSRLMCHVELISTVPKTLKLAMVSVGSGSTNSSNSIIGSLGIPITYPPTGPAWYPIKQSVPRSAKLVISFQESTNNLKISVKSVHGLPEGNCCSYVVTLSIPGLEKRWETEPSVDSSWQFHSPWCVPVQLWKTNECTLLFSVINSSTCDILGQVSLCPRDVNSETKEYSLFPTNVGFVYAELLVTEKMKEIPQFPQGHSKIDLSPTDTRQNCSQLSPSGMFV